MPDPITLEIVRGAVSSIIRQMEALIERTAMSPVIKEKMDYFVGVYDLDGRVVDGFLSTSGPRIVDPVLREYPLDQMRPGDLYWYNDPHLSKGAIQHTGDMCFTSPVFYGGEPVAFAVSYGHFWDIGGSVAGSLSPQASRNLPRRDASPAHPHHARRRDKPRSIPRHSQQQPIPRYARRRHPRPNGRLPTRRRPTSRANGSLHRPHRPSRLQRNSPPQRRSLPRLRPRNHPRRRAPFLRLRRRRPRRWRTPPSRRQAAPPRRTPNSRPHRQRPPS